MEGRMSRLVPVVLLLGSISGSCASPTIPDLLREEPAHTRGTITEYDSSAGSTFLLEDRPDLDSGEKYIVRIDSRTEIFKRTAAGDTVRGDVQDIRTQSRAAVWFEGPILESYPAQGVARYVLMDTVILE
jgi:hypothetical protein